LDAGGDDYLTKPFSSGIKDPKEGRICTEKADRPTIAFLRQFDLGQPQLLVRAAMWLGKLVTA
jgi:hypothetical protein